VVVDHSALKSALQTNTTGRRSNRLNEWGMYLSTFLPRMKIIPKRFWLQSSSVMGTFEEIEQGGELGGDDDLFVGLEVQRWGFIRA